jgi:hypothetical protein
MRKRVQHRVAAAGGLALGAALVLAAACAGRPASRLPFHRGPSTLEPWEWERDSYGPLAVVRRTPEDARERSSGCVSCHGETDSPTMHPTGSIFLACTDCHGGDHTVHRIEELALRDPKNLERMHRAHVLPRHPERWTGSANPPGLGVAALDESAEFIRFVNPGDLRVAHLTCGSSDCHAEIVQKVQRSMMTHGAMLWSAALYNNGAVPFKDARFGEAYAPDGRPVRLRPWYPDASLEPPVEERAVRQRFLGELPQFDPLPRWNVTQPGNILRVFERGGRKKAEIGIPNPFEPPGEPENKLSNRGYGTLLRTDPVFIGLQKTRLLDPLLSLFGTNDHPGDYRSSGCSACHVIYANDRSPAHSGSMVARFGNRGRRDPEAMDPTIPEDESGHPIRHVFTRSIPTSQCIVCHVHPGTAVMNAYLGTIWWDNETDGDLLYREPHERNLSPWKVDAIQRRNPEGSAPLGKWSDPEFLAEVGSPEFNAKLRNVQFADFHGHGWLFRNVYKQDLKGRLLDAEDRVVADDDPEKFEKAVHLKDIHLEKGMHCIDCHFEQDSHGNGKLYGEMRAAVEIQCADCHGTIFERASLRTSGWATRDLPDGKPKGRDLTRLPPTPFGKRRFETRGERRIQRGIVEDLEWEIAQVKDTLDPRHPRHGKAGYAHTIRKDNASWGTAPEDPRELAHPPSEMNCVACHTSWMTSCFGCHLPMVANQRKPMLHGEGDTSRNWVQYDFQTLRTDAFMLGRDGTATSDLSLKADGTFEARGRISPVRSSCAVLVSSQNEKRQWLYSQQQTVSAGGFSGHAFTTHVPHTVRARETKRCADCHLSEKNDNNAWLSQVLGLGTNFTNFIGRYAYVATGRDGFEAVAVTERGEPQAVIGSNLHRMAFPEEHARHEARGRMLAESYHHGADDELSVFSKAEVLSVQLRGEYLYAATGTGGLRVFDVANVDNKDFSERMISAPVSPLGQRFYVRTKYATAVAAPATVALDPVRKVLPENEEQAIHPLYGYLYVADRDEGLVVVGAASLLDGNPDNNFLERAATFNPSGILNGAANLTVAGTHVYVLADRGLVVVDVDDPVRPRVVAEIGRPFVSRPRSIAIQFRYAFVTDEEGLEVIDLTDPERPRPIPEAAVQIADARGLYVARTYAYVAAGSQGLVIVDVEKPEQPFIDQVFDAGGAIRDASDVKTGMTNNSLFAYVADGENGLRVIELMTSGHTPGFNGFSPRPTPRLVATFRTSGPALAVSEGTDRDRCIDESGNQIGVFNRRGARPFHRDEMRRLYLEDGKPYTVSNEPPPPGRAPEDDAAPASPAGARE